LLWVWLGELAGAILWGVEREEDLEEEDEETCDLFWDGGVEFWFEWVSWEEGEEWRALLEMQWEGNNIITNIRMDV
jgi:hypothetical protein